MNEQKLKLDIAAILGDDSMVERIMSTIEKNSHYSVQAVKEYYYYNIDNRLSSRIDDDITFLRGQSIDELYEKIAQYQIKYETPEDDCDDDYTLVSFSNLTRVFGSYDLLDREYVDDDRITQTVAWKKHQEELEQKRINEEKEIEREKLREEQKIKEQELALLASLQEKYKDA
jgi:hypothetical protein